MQGFPASATPLSRSAPPSIARARGRGPLLPSALALSLALATAPGAAAAGELSHNDRIAALWSGRFSMEEDGRPLVSIGVAEGAREVTLSPAAGGPLRVWPESPEGGTEVSAAGALRVRALESHPADEQWLVVLESIPGDHSGGGDYLAERVARWRAKGVEPRIVERGAVFGVAGTTLDTRVRLLTAPGDSDRAKAAARAADAKVRYGATGEVEPNVERPAGGLLEITSADGAVRVVARDAVWFGGAAPEDLVHVQVGAEAGHLYRGQVYVTFGADGTLLVGNTLSAEEMLYGLVPVETFASAPIEALKAQALTARGTLLAKIGHAHSGEPFLLCATTHCQVYAGADRETTRTTGAVAATRGEVLFGRDGLVNTLYSASCGGFAESCETVWDRSPSPYLRAGLDGPAAAALAGLGLGPAGAAGPLDPFAPFRAGLGEANLRAFLAASPATWCRRSTFEKGGTYRWKVTRTAAEMDALVARALPAVGRVKGLRVLGRGAGGRVTGVEVTGERGAATVARELAVRTLFGGLKSGLFVVDVTRAPDGRPAAFTFTGGGFGHGVGMCQQGAVGMAEASLRYDTILAHYYGGAKVKRLY
ncbi:MAG TPA: SpoIID/LytB domain-containing protein [Myxococcota bacterium]|jgi:peptidoglycan hydrolase-like amidase|nr:SpoIID/LytB domain-containing protein [Myxococcota bacterium]